jgi:antitoxin HicB
LSTRYVHAGIFEEDDGAISVRVPDIPEVVTSGYSREEAEEYAVDAIETVLREYMRRRWEIPTPSIRRGRNVRLIRLPVVTQAKLALYSAMRSGAIRKADLGRRLGWSKNQVERLWTFGTLPVWTSSRAPWGP